jgi:DNA-directed RNA polymerase subunit RPC12/RpoP
MPLKYIKNENGDFTCPHCPIVIPGNKQSTMHYHLKRHELDNTAKDTSYTCKECKKSFLQKQTLELHMKSKHAELLEEDTTKIQCPHEGCEFTSLTKGNCIIHFLRIHYNEEIKKCMTVHKETKTMECHECGKDFTNASSFYYHCKDCNSFDTTTDKYTSFQELIA